MPTWRKQYDPDIDDALGEQTAIYFDDPSKTQQHHKRDTDINEILKRSGIRGTMPPAALDPKYYGDFTDAVDLQTAVMRIKTAQERFMLLPADTRARFLNDPARLLDFLQDEKNLDEAVKLGLLVRKPEPVKPAPIEVIVTNTPTTSDTPK